MSFTKAMEEMNYVKTNPNCNVQPLDTIIDDILKARNLTPEQIKDMFNDIETNMPHKGLFQQEPTSPLQKLNSKKQSLDDIFKKMEDGEELEEYYHPLDEEDELTSESDYEDLGKGKTA